MSVLPTRAHQLINGSIENNIKGIDNAELLLHGFYLLVVALPVLIGIYLWAFLEGFILEMKNYSYQLNFLIFS